MTSELILGRDFLQDTEVVIKREQIEVRRLPIEKYATKTTKPDAAEKEDSENQGFDVLTVMPRTTVNEIKAPPRYKDKIETMIAEYEPKKNVKTPIETRIVLKDDIPVSHSPRRLAPKEMEILDEQIREWLRLGIITPSNSEYASPVVLVRKKDGSSRICIDYRALNKTIFRDKYPMPLIDDKIDALVNFRVFSILDLKNGSFHVPVSSESRKYSAFVTPTGQYEFTKTPFGLCNSPTSFLRFVHEVFRDLIQRSIVFMYVDDIIIPGYDEEDAFPRLMETIAVVAENGLDIN